MNITQIQKFWLESDFVFELLKQIPASVFWKDRNSVYLGCNDIFAHSLGLSSPEEVIGKTDYDLPTTKEESDAFRTDDKHVIKTKQPKLNIEEYQTLPDGRRVTLLTNKVPLLDKQNNVMGILGIYHDITERKKNEAELLQAKIKAAANQSKSLFLAVMSHELTNRLGNIMSAIDIAREKLVNVKNSEKLNPTLDWLSLAYTESKSVLPFLKNVTEYLELDSGLIDSKLAPVQLTEMLSKLASGYIDKLKANKIDLLLNITNSFPTNILIDSYNVYRVLDTVIGNAIRFTHTGTITIKAQIEKSNYLAIIIQDTGKGIPQAQLKNIFNAFCKDKVDINSKYKKFGLKLSIAKQIMELINGDIIIASQEGKGTEVKLLVPYLDNKNERRIGIINTKQKRRKTKNAKNLKLLVVEDDPVSLNFQVHILNSMGYEVHFVSTGEEAIEKARQNQYHIIFMDITLPGMTGIEASQEIMKLRSDRPLIVAVTSHATEESVEDILASGIDELIEKPINQEKFELFFNTTYPSLIEDGD